LLDLVPAACFVFQGMISELAGISMVQEAFQKKWDGVLKIIAKEAFAAALRRQKEQCKKCV
jgi:hypothetical protein